MSNAGAPSRFFAGALLSSKYAIKSAIDQHGGSSRLAILRVVSTRSTPLSPALPRIRTIWPGNPNAINEPASKTNKSTTEVPARSARADSLPPVCFIMVIRRLKISGAARPALVKIDPLSTKPAAGKVFRLSSTRNPPHRSMTPPRMAKIAMLRAMMFMTESIALSTSGPPVENAILQSYCRALCLVLAVFVALYARVPCQMPKQKPR